MTYKYAAKSDLYQEFLLCVKFEGGYDTYGDFYDLLRDDGWVQQTELSDISDDIANTGDIFTGRGNVLLKSSNETMALLIHENGPEAWIIPFTAFVAGSIASGVIGNAAYDLIQRLFAMLIRAREKRYSEDTVHTSSFDYGARHSEIKIILRTPDYQTVDLARLTRSRQIELIQKIIGDRLSQMNLEHGVAPEIKSLMKRLDDLEDQLKATQRNYALLADEFQKERIEWRSRSENHNLRISTLELPGMLTVRKK
jgi:hypothetical protein